MEQRLPKRRQELPGRAATAARANRDWWRTSFKTFGFSISTTSRDLIDWARRSIREEFKKVDIRGAGEGPPAMRTARRSGGRRLWPNDGRWFIRMGVAQRGNTACGDARGGAGAGQRCQRHQQRPDNGNLDKARRVLWR